MSAALSLAFNTTLLALPWSAGGTRPYEPRAPIVLNLEPEPEPATVVSPPDRPPQAIETAQETLQPPENTNLFSDKNAAASGPVLHDGAHPGPPVEEESELAAAPMPPPTPSKRPETQSISPVEREDAKNKRALAEETPSKSRIDELLAANDEPSEGKATDAKEDHENLLARAAPEPLSDAAQRARGRLDGRVMEQGFVGFEAIRDDVAAYYLEHVKPRIRRNWITNMLARYSGTMRAVAEVEMAIAPDGSLAYAEIRGEPSNRIFAGLCKFSIEQAGPFPPFPFRVPPEYRNQNLVVHCRFHWQ